MSLNKRIGFIGGGQMCSALAGGMIRSGIVGKSSVTISDSYQPQLDKLRDTLGVNVTAKNCEVVKNSDIVVLAVKPDTVLDVLSNVRQHITKEKLIVSICAGISMKSLETAIDIKGARVCRVMPNTPSLYGVGASGYCLNGDALPTDSSDVEALLKSVGLAVNVKEKDIDAVAGVSGSSPAYVFMFIEALADGGVRAGLARPVAMKLATQAVLGSAVMVQQSGIHPGALKDNVCSAGGTTIAAVHALEDGGFRGSVIDAVLASSERSKYLTANL